MCLEEKVEVNISTKGYKLLFDGDIFCANGHKVMLNGEGFRLPSSLAAYRKAVVLNKAATFVILSLPFLRIAIRIASSSQEANYSQPNLHGAVRLQRTAPYVCGRTAIKSE
jgi:hypothetical protein